jgi:CRISPR-associated protein Csx14
MDTDRQILIATLGTEPQVVTLALDLLQAKGYAIAEVIAMHTIGEAVRPALARLREEFTASGACGFRQVAVQGAGGPVRDIITEEDVAALLRTMYRTVVAEKRAGRLIHLSIAGGREPMAV